MVRGSWRRSNRRGRSAGELGGRAERVLFEDADLAAEREGGERRHAGQRAAADQAKTGAGEAAVGALEDFAVVGFGPAQNFSRRSTRLSVS